MATMASEYHEQLPSQISNGARYKLYDHLSRGHSINCPAVKTFGGEPLGLLLNFLLFLLIQFDERDALRSLNRST